MEEGMHNQQILQQASNDQRGDNLELRMANIFARSSKVNRSPTKGIVPKEVVLHDADNAKETLPTKLD